MYLGWRWDDSRGTLPLPGQRRSWPRLSRVRRSKLAHNFAAHRCAGGRSTLNKTPRSHRLHRPHRSHHPSLLPLYHTSFRLDENLEFVDRPSAISRTLFDAPDLTYHTTIAAGPRSSLLDALLLSLPDLNTKSPSLLLVQLVDRGLRTIRLDINLC